MFWDVEIRWLYFDRKKIHEIRFVRYSKRAGIPVRPERWRCGGGGPPDLWKRVPRRPALDPHDPRCAVQFFSVFLTLLSIVNFS